MSIGVGWSEREPWVAPASIEDTPVDYIHVMPDRYTVYFATDDDIQQFAADVADGSDQYTVMPGSDWDAAGPQEVRETGGVPIHEEEDAVYLRQGVAEDRYMRSYYAAGDQHSAEVAVTVPVDRGQHQVAPLHDALAPFYDDADLLDAVTAVEDALDRVDAGSVEKVEP